MVIEGEGVLVGSAGFIRCAGIHRAMAAFYYSTSVSSSSRLPRLEVEDKFEHGVLGTTCLLADVDRLTLKRWLPAWQRHTILPFIEQGLMPNTGKGHILKSMKIGLELLLTRHESNDWAGRTLGKR